MYCTNSTVQPRRHFSKTSQGASFSLLRKSVATVILSWLLTCPIMDNSQHSIPHRHGIITATIVLPVRGHSSGAPAPHCCSPGHSCAPLPAACRGVLSSPTASEGPSSQGQALSETPKGSAGHGYAGQQTEGSVGRGYARQETEGSAAI